MNIDAIVRLVLMLGIPSFMMCGVIKRCQKKNEMK